MPQRDAEDRVAARKRRLSHTNIARLQLLASPLLLLVLFVLALLDAGWEASKKFAERMRWSFDDDWRWFYRSVYRVARYGSVWDD